MTISVRIPQNSCKVFAENGGNLIYQKLESVLLTVFYSYLICYSIIYLFISNK